jgi:hypothetical protein
MDCTRTLHCYRLGKGEWNIYPHQLFAFAVGSFFLSFVIRNPALVFGLGVGLPDIVVARLLVGRTVVVVGGTVIMVSVIYIYFTIISFMENH